VLLLIVFMFIFFGIKAFTVGGSFSAVINSLLPALAGVSMGGKDKKIDSDSDTKIVKAVEESVKHVLGSILKDKKKKT